MRKIHPLNILFSLTSLTVVAVSIERFSFTARTYLQPFNYLRLHELFQMSILILATVIIPFLTLWIITDKFKNLQNKYGLILALVFIIGIYFYATGNGVHEMASFTLNTYCNLSQKLHGNFCWGQYINDYYTGNIFYFIGAFMINIALVIFEFKNPNNTFKKKDRTLLIINSLIYSLAIIAYSAFDVVLVGLIFSIIMTAILISFVLKKKHKLTEIPVTSSMGIAYTIGTVVSIVIRIIRL